VNIAIQGFTGAYMGGHRNTGVHMAIYCMSYNPGDYMEGDYIWYVV